MRIQFMLYLRVNDKGTFNDATIKINKSSSAIDGGFLIDSRRTVEMVIMQIRKVDMKKF